MMSYNVYYSFPQINRLHQCEKMLLALELAGWLNEANLALQGVVQCYGLLAPLLFHNIPSIAVMQVILTTLLSIFAFIHQQNPTFIVEYPLFVHFLSCTITFYDIMSAGSGVLPCSSSGNTCWSSSETPGQHCRKLTPYDSLYHLLPL